VNTKRLPFPALIQNAPSCPVCYTTVSFDGDGWECKTCHVTWSSDAYDVEGTTDEDFYQCPAEVAPYEHSERDFIRGYRYRCVRDEGHPMERFEHHVGARSDGGPDYDGYPFEWDDDEYPQWQPEATETVT
jgi:hypothetical protein